MSCWLGFLFYKRVRARKHLARCWMYGGTDISPCVLQSVRHLCGCVSAVLVATASIFIMPSPIECVWCCVNIARMNSDVVRQRLSSVSAAWASP